MDRLVGTRASVRALLEHVADIERPPELSIMPHDHFPPVVFRGVLMSAGMTLLWGDLAIIDKLGLQLSDWRFNCRKPPLTSQRRK